MGSMKKAPHGKSFNTDKGAKNPAAAKTGKLHKAGKSVPSWDSTRNDKLDNQGVKGTGGVKS